MDKPINQPSKDRFKIVQTAQFIRSKTLTLSAIQLNIKIFGSNESYGVTSIIKSAILFVCVCVCVCVRERESVF